MSVLTQVASRLRAEGGLLAATVTEAQGEQTGWEPIEAIREGYLLHYAARARIVATEDPDLGLLAGDRLYALGLEELAGLGELEAVRTMAAVIADAAAAQAAGDQATAEAAWNRAPQGASPPTADR